MVSLVLSYATVPLTVWCRDFRLMGDTILRVALTILSRALCPRFRQIDTQRYACAAFAKFGTYIDDAGRRHRRHAGRVCTTLSRSFANFYCISPWFFFNLLWHLWTQLSRMFANPNCHEYSSCGYSALDQYDFKKKQSKPYSMSIDYCSDCTQYNIVFLAPPSSQQLWQGFCLLSLVFSPLPAEDR